MTSPEKVPHIPKVKTTPERVLEKAPKNKPTGQAVRKEQVSKKEKLSPKEVEARVTELAELSAARAEASKHMRKIWGGLIEQEREDLKAKGKEAVIAHLDSLEIDPELREFAQSSLLAETDARIQELASNPDVLKAYKNRFETLKGTLAKVIAFEHLQKELRAVESREKKLRLLYEKFDWSPGPIERKKLEGLANRITEIREELEKFELDEAAVDMLRRREIRGIKRDLARYNFAETETRTELIREILPDLLLGKPVLLQGETGSGKTEMARYICEKYLGKKPVLVPIHEQIKESQVIGRFTLKDGATEYIYSEIFKAVKEGRPVILDEINRMPPEFASIFYPVYDLRVGTGQSLKHPVTGEEIIPKPGFIVFATGNLKSKRYAYSYKIPSEVYRRFKKGGGIYQIDYLDLGKKNEKGEYIAPETALILRAVMADRHGVIQCRDEDNKKVEDEFYRFLAACRKIQEDFTECNRIDSRDAESFIRSGIYAFEEIGITIYDQIQIIKKWRDNGFRDPLEKFIISEFFRKYQVMGRPEKDRANMVRVFAINKFFKDTKPEDFKIPSLAAQSLRQWQDKK